MVMRANMMDVDQQKSLVSRWKQGNSQAFQALYDEFFGAIYRFVYYRVSHRETAEDIVSDVFLKAVARIGQFDEAKGTFQSWLYGVARNAVVDHYRTHKETQDLEDAGDIGSSHDVGGDVDRGRELEKVRAYLNTLPEDSRDIIMMRVWDDLSYAQIAEIIGKSEEACKMAFSRAIGKLRKEMPLATLIMILLHCHSRL